MVVETSNLNLVTATTMKDLRVGANKAAELVLLSLIAWYMCRSRGGKAA